ncbi:MAG: hypothetical protein QM504_08865 [Pseudomonadota bacterium]
MMKKISFICFLVVIIASKVHAVNYFGLKTQIWEHMWVNGESIDAVKNINNHKKKQWNVSKGNLSKYSDLGATWNIIIVRHRLGDQLDFKRLHRIIDEHKVNGINVVFRLIEDPKVYKNFLGAPDKIFGYNRQYYRWVKALSAEFKNDVFYYLIGNEVDHDLGHNLPKYREVIINGDDYLKLVYTAKLALSARNNKFKVVDHGVSSFTLGLAVADFLKENYGLQRAANFWSAFHYQRQSGYFSKNRLQKMLESKKIRNRINIAKSTYLNCKYYDAIQLHHYFSPDVLPVILDWINNQLNYSQCDVEIIATEIGYRLPFKKGEGWDGRVKNVADWDKYLPEEHSATMVKDFVILMSRGIDKILYWQLRFHHDNNPTATLYKSTGNAIDFIITPAVKAYNFYTMLMENATSTDVRIVNNPNIREFQFTSDHIISVIWSANKNQYLDLLKLPEIKSIYDMYGVPITNDKKSKLLVTESPVFIIWKTTVVKGF